MRARATPILTLGLLALALGLSACGSSVKSTIDPVAAAAEKTSAQETMRMSMTMTMNAFAPKPLTLTAEGAANLSEQKSSMSMDMSQFASLAGGQLGSRYDGKTEAVMDGLVMYMRAPYLQTALGSNQTWIKMDLGSIGKQMGFDYSAFMSSNPNQMTQYLDYLRGADGAQVLGHESIRGVETTHYRATVDFDRYLDLLPADKRGLAKKSLDNLRKQSDQAIEPFDVWIDSQNRVRRLKIIFSETSTDNSGDTSTIMEIEFFDFNKPVSITIPPADQTADLMELVGSLGQG